uniref:hypothetical protein n=1 Tax=Marinobacterium profundum TaxID=1714300 RepID=UPI0008325032|nr:hypothetical protein [Marinobacterium profundum]
MLLLFLLCAGAVLYGLFRPAPPPNLFRESDKVLHLLAFATLALTGRAALSRLPGIPFWGLLLVLAPMMEWAQHIVQPVRHFSLEDALANLTGILLAGLCWWLVKAGARLKSRG